MEVLILSIWSRLLPSPVTKGTDEIIMSKLTASCVQHFLHVLKLDCVRDFLKCHMGNMSNSISYMLRKEDNRNVV